MKIMKAQKLMSSLINEVEKNKIELEKEKQDFANELKKYKKVDLFPVKRVSKISFFEKIRILLWGK
jgi:hypothetical protein